MEYQLINLRLLALGQGDRIAATLAEDATELLRRLAVPEELVDGIAYSVHLIHGPTVKPGTGSPVPLAYRHLVAELADAGYAIRPRPASVDGQPIERPVDAFVAGLSALGELPFFALADPRTYGANERLDKIEEDIAYLRGAVEAVRADLEEDIRRSGNEWSNLVRGQDQLTARISREEDARYSAFTANADSIAALANDTKDRLGAVERHLASVDDDVSAGAEMLGELEAKLEKLRVSVGNIVSVLGAVDDQLAARIVKQGKRIKRQAKALREAFDHTHPEPNDTDDPGPLTWTCNECGHSFPRRGRSDPRIAAHLALHQPATGGLAARIGD